MKLTATNNVNTTKQGRRHTHNAKDAETLNEKRGTGVGVAEVGVVPKFQLHREGESTEKQKHKIINLT